MTEQKGFARGAKRRALGALIALAAVACAPAPASARVPADFVGLASEDVFAGDANYRTANLSAQAAIGVGLLRQTFRWSDIEREPGQYDLSAYDEYVAKCAAHGITLLPILFDPPAFRSSAPASGARPGTYPPASFADLGAFGAVLVARYGPRGTLWAERPDVPRRPIRAWQIWNEPNLRVYWPTGPNPRRYTALLRAASTAIKRADRGAEIVTAGMPQSRLGTPLLRFIAGMYRAGARSAFDTLAVNPYAGSERQVLALITDVRRVMNKSRDRRARIWATEIGWASKRGRSAQSVGSSGQAARIKRLLPLLGANRRKLRLRGLVYYAWKDALPYPPAYRDIWGLHSGLLDLHGRPKRAFYAFKRGVGALR